MSPFRFLGLKKSATIAQIKRAYAVKLKQTRPEDDPAGFQQLREIFQAALDSAHRRDLQHAAKADAAGTEQAMAENPVDDDVAVWPVYPAHADIDDHTMQTAPSPDAEAPAIMPLPADVPAVMPMPRPFDFGAFLGDLQKAGSGELRTFQHWLETQPDLYSLSLKQELAWPLVHHFADADPPLRPKHLAALFAFFSLDSVGPRLNELSQLTYLARQHSENYWRPELVAERIQHVQASWTDQLLFNELKGPPHLLRRAFILLFPGLKQWTYKIAEELSATAPEHQRRVVDPAAVDFWLRVGNRHAVSGWRMASMLLQLSAFAIFLRLLIGEGGMALAIIVATAWLLWLAAAANNARLLRRVRDTGVLPAVHWWQRNWKWLLAIWFTLQVARLLAG